MSHVTSSASALEKTLLATAIILPPLDDRRSFAAFARRRARTFDCLTCINVCSEFNSLELPVKSIIVVN
jgi:hypothetical protein